MDAAKEEANRKSRESDQNAVSTALLFKLRNMSESCFGIVRAFLRQGHSCPDTVVGRVDAAKSFLAGLSILLAPRGHNATLSDGSDYFTFSSGDAEDYKESFIERLPSSLCASFEPFDAFSDVQLVVMTDKSKVGDADVSVVMVPDDIMGMMGASWTEQLDFMRKVTRAKALEDDAVMDFKASCASVFLDASNSIIEHHLEDFKGDHRPDKTAAVPGSSDRRHLWRAYGLVSQIEFKCKRSALEKLGSVTQKQATKLVSAQSDDGRNGAKFYPWVWPKAPLPPRKKARRSKSKK